jgi:hypothetical protein
MNMVFPNSTKNPHPPAASSFDVGELVDTKTAAKVLGLHNHHTLEVWRSTKRHQELRFIRIGRAVRYSLSDLKRFLQANSVGGAPIQRATAEHFSNLDRLGEAR